MRILVTGVTGQVGHALLQTLTPYGTVVAANRAMLDLSRPGDLAARLDELRPDVIVNPAAYTAVDRAEDDRDAAFAVNATSPGAIAVWAATHRVPLIHFSTDYVFDGSGDRPWREDDATGPLGVYGASKLAGEQAVLVAGGASLIVRTSWVYAAQGANFMRTIARLASERDELRIVADQIGAPTSARWIADVIAQIFEQHAFNLATVFGQARHKVNVAAAGETSWHGFAMAIVDGLKRRGLAIKVRSVVPIESKDYPVRAIRPKNSRLDMGRLKETFKIEAEPWAVLLDHELDHWAAAPKA